MIINNNEQYEKWITFNLRHAYFTNDKVPVSLSPTGATGSLLRRNNAVFRRDAPDSWSVCIRSGKYFSAYDALSFEIQPNTKDFYYYSVLQNDKFDGWSITDSDKPGVWKMIEISIENDTTPTPLSRNINIEIKTIEKYIEFFFIPKYNPSDIRLRLTENKGNIIFSEPEIVHLWDNEHVQRIVSTKPLTMKYPRPLKMKLWEIRNGGERLLSDTVPLPACDNPSPLSPKDTITTYFYY